MNKKEAKADAWRIIIQELNDFIDDDMDDLVFEDEDEGEKVKEALVEIYNDLHEKYFEK
jgi:hypothetical protein